MENTIVVYKYDDQEIEFDLGKNVMVNATEMAKIFGKQPKDFLDNEQTKRFIKECLKKVNSPFISVEKVEDLVRSRKKSGTWMHRILALKFAAWLNPAFELWIYHTIDRIVFATARQIEETNHELAVLIAEEEALEERLTIDSDDFRRLKVIQLTKKQLAYRKGRVNKDQLDLFKEREKEARYGS